MLGVGVGYSLYKEDIAKIIKRQKPYFWKDGWVTISGWECTLQAKSLTKLFKILKKAGINTCLDTNASTLTNDVKELLKYTDIVMPDIKHFYDTNHKKITSRSNKTTLSFIEYLEKIKKPFWIRHVLVIWYTDSKQHIEDLGKYCKKFKHLQRVEILPYHELWKHKREQMWRKYKLEWTKSPNKKQAEKAKKILQKYVKNVYIR
jgi:pyruvate formate lyase activating enzyme